MRMKHRVKKLEKAHQSKEKWAVFTISYYAESDEEELAKRRLLDEYLADGHSYPHRCLFINEVPTLSETMQEENFLYSFMSSG